MPAKNAALFVAEAVESVLAQGATVSELIVVDDGSTDETNAILRRFNPRSIRLLAND